MYAVVSLSQMRGLSRPKDNLEASVLSFHTGGPRDATQLVKLGGKHFPHQVIFPGLFVIQALLGERGAGRGELWGSLWARSQEDTMQEQEWLCLSKLEGKS